MSKTADTTGAPAPPLPENKAEKTDVKNILGVDVRNFTKATALAFIENAIAKNSHKKLAFLNAHGANIAYSKEDYRATLKNFDVLADGIGLDMGSDALYGNRFPDNLNGTDFLPDLFKHLKRPVTIGLLGGEEGVAEKAARNLWEVYQPHDFVVIHHGFFSDDEQEEILRCLEWFHPDILLVALGNPGQERWIADYCTDKHATITMGVGAFFDFMSGKVRRAPDWMIKLRIEWLYRLSLEPGRMWRRYVLGNPLFLFRIYRQKLLGLPTGRRHGE